MSSLTFFFILIPILVFLLLAINILLSPHNPYQEKNSASQCRFSLDNKNFSLNLKSSSNIWIFILFLVLSNYLYHSIPPAIYKDITFSTSLFISTITIDLQSNNLDPYLLDCIYRQLLLHINCNLLYLRDFPFSIAELNIDSPIEYTSYINSYELASKNLAHLYVLLEKVKSIK